MVSRTMIHFLSAVILSVTSEKEFLIQERNLFLTLTSEDLRAFLCCGHA